MTEKEKILNIIYKKLIESGEIIHSIEDLDKFNDPELSLSNKIKDNWPSENEFFNELAEFGFKRNSEASSLKNIEQQQEE